MNHSTRPKLPSLMSLRLPNMQPPGGGQPGPPCCNHHPFHTLCSPSCLTYGCPYCCPPIPPLTNLTPRGELLAPGLTRPLRPPTIPQWPIRPLPFLPPPGQAAPRPPWAAWLQLTPGPPGPAQLPHQGQRVPSPPRSARPAAGQQQQLVNAAQQSPMPLMSIKLPPSFSKSPQ